VSSDLAPAAQDSSSDSDGGDNSSVASDTSGFSVFSRFSRTSSFCSSSGSVSTAAQSITDAATLLLTSLLPPTSAELVHPAFSGYIVRRQCSSTTAATAAAGTAATTAASTGVGTAAAAAAAGCASCQWDAAVVSPVYFGADVAVLSSSSSAVRGAAVVEALRAVKQAASVSCRS
jgi:hypothetical protein